MVIAFGNNSQGLFLINLFIEIGQNLSQLKESIFKFENVSIFFSYYDLFCWICSDFL